MEEVIAEYEGALKDDANYFGVGQAADTSQFAALDSQSVFIENAHSLIVRSDTYVVFVDVDGDCFGTHMKTIYSEYSQIDSKRFINVFHQLLPLSLLLLRHVAGIVSHQFTNPTCHIVGQLSLYELAVDANHQSYDQGQGNKHNDKKSGCMTFGWFFLLLTIVSCLAV